VPFLLLRCDINHIHKLFCVDRITLNNKIYTTVGNKIINRRGGGIYETNSPIDKRA
jgi:hypothetical protein